jgi:hypothetical protein
MPRMSQADARQWLLTVVAVGIVIFWAANPDKVNPLVLTGVLSMLGLGIVVPGKKGGNDESSSPPPRVGKQDEHGQEQVDRPPVRPRRPGFPPRPMDYRSAELCGP